ncbi:MAG: L,D-transpeptidase family protein [Candidatus Nanopelagicales bacterium]
MTPRAWALLLLGSALVLSGCGASPSHRSVDDRVSAALERSIPRVEAARLDAQVALRGVERERERQAELAAQVAAAAAAQAAAEAAQRAAEQAAHTATAEAERAARPAATARAAPPARPATPSPPPPPGGVSPASIPALDRSGQALIVTAARSGTSTATLTAWQRDADGSWSVAYGPMTARIGRAGFLSDRREGDGSTPVGTFALPFSFGIAADPGTALEYRQVDDDDWWAGDSDDPATYNTWQSTRPADAAWLEDRSEHLVDYSAAYRHAVVIGFNSERTPWRGSAIFLHVATGSSTAGCVAIDAPALVELLRWLDPGQSPRIAMGPVRALVP